MEKSIRRILNDLYRMDPALRDREDDVKKVIKELLEGKPDAKIDKRFERELKEKLLAQFSADGNRRKLGLASLWAKPAFKAVLGIAAAACLTVVVFTRFGYGAKSAPSGVDVLPPFAGGRLTLSEPVADSKAEPAKAKSTVEKKEKAGSAATGVAVPASTVLCETESAASIFATRGAMDADGLGGAMYAEAQEIGRTRDYLETMQNAPALSKAMAPKDDTPVAVSPVVAGQPEFNTEEYDRIAENAWNDPAKEPLSTFSIDVDTASYANVRRYIESGSLPPQDAVRIEELINYFTYDYAEPRGDDPLAFDTELAACPWKEGNYLLKVGLQARRIADNDMPPSNLVFLIDVSGSMDEENKLPLVRESLKLLAGKMRQQDKISIVVYSGAAGQVLPPTSGARKDEILRAIDNLEAGGSTAGGEGIELAYEAAKKAFIAKGNNRVVLATDGDFNVGASSDAALVRMIEEKRTSGIFLTVLGYGMGNFKDSKMQKLADSGNGNYAYVDSIKEAEKVLSKQMAGTLFTVAKDVKIQIEFNPATVASYRLIGYEKRILAAKDFEDDTKDAGELGAGHSVTALYEIVPTSGSAGARTDLKYQKSTISPAAAGGDLMTIKFRYKKPDGDTSKLIEKAVPWKPVSGKPSEDFRFAQAVAEWGLLLRDSEYKGNASFSQVEDLATGSLAKGRDSEGYRAEFLELVRKSSRLSREQ